MKIGRIIRKRRRELDLTQMQLAKKLGVHNFQIFRWEKEISAPSSENFLELCHVLGLKLEDFQKESKQKELGPTLN